MRNKLIEKRKLKNLSQAEVSRRIGVDRSHYCNIEKGKRGLSLEMAHKISKVLGMKLEYKNFENEEK